MKREEMMREKAFVEGTHQGAGRSGVVKAVNTLAKLNRIKEVSLITLSNRGGIPYPIISIQ